MAQFHLVLATLGRRGVFGSEEARQVATEWRERQGELRVALTKVSFVPDHVHIAARAHPAVAPADLVVAVNAAQEIMMPELVHARLNRLWQPSAYVGGYGDLASAQMRKYIENWAAVL